MIARFHYDDATFNRLLHDSLGEDEQDVAQHVETCEVCQEKIDTHVRNFKEIVCVDLRSAEAADAVEAK